MWLGSITLTALREACHIESLGVQYDSVFWQPQPCLRLQTSFQDVRQYSVGIWAEIVPYRAHLLEPAGNAICRFPSR